MSDVCVPLDAFYEAVFLTDRDFRVVACNLRAVELFRATSKESLVGRPLERFSPEGAARLAEGFRDRLTKEPFVVAESRALRDDGTIFVAEGAAHRIDENAVLVTVRDVTQRVETLHRAEEANERLRAVDRDRMEFVSNVSHELRTPLTSMSYALTNMLRGVCGQLPEKAVGYLERLQSDVRRLTTTVNDILDLRQIENGTLTLHKTCLPLRQLLAEAADALSVQAEAKRQQLTVLQGEREVYALADRNKIERVFFNLLSNAVKYTPEGGTIQASVHREGKMAFVAVEDNGIGIPPEALPRVSQRYFRVGDQVTGTGLGLSIVREIVELHGGTLLLESPVPGKTCGTRATVSLPACEGPLIIVISDDETFCHEISSAAESLGSDVRVNRTGRSVLSIGSERLPARFVLDGTLPDAILSELIIRIRKDRRFSQTPILILSPKMETSLLQEYRQMHVDVRPFPLAPRALRTALGVGKSA